MKKNIFLVLLTALSINISAQEVKPISFSKVIQAEGMDKLTIYDKVRTWFALSIKDANWALVMDDKDTGSLIGKVNVKYAHSNEWQYELYKGSIDFVVHVKIKDERILVELKDFQFVYGGEGVSGLPEKITTSEDSPYKALFKKRNQVVWDRLKIKINDLAEMIFAGLEQELNSESDW